MAVASLKYCLVHVEGISGHDVQLLDNEYGEVTMNDSDAIAPLTGDFPGSKEDQPIVFTYAQMTQVAIRSTAFSDHYVSLDAAGLTHFTPSGGGRVFASTELAVYQTFFLQRNDDGTISFKSTVFSDVYIRLDGSNTARSWEKFCFHKRDSGYKAVVGIESAAFPGRFLRLREEVVNAQGVCGDHEQFEVLEVG